MPGALQIFEATPTMVGNKVSWELCYLDVPNEPKSEQQCGKTKGTYPDVELAKDQGQYPFQFTIVNDNTGKGIKFAEGALVIKKGEPFGPGKEKQIGEIAASNSNKKLTFVDLNSLPNTDYPDPVVITYGLHFTDKDENPVTSIDPDITNGGNPGIIDPPSVGPGGGRGISYADYAPAFAVGLIAGIVLMLLFQRFRRTG